MIDGQWINDVAHDLNAELLRDIFMLCQLINLLNLDLTSEQGDQIIWTLESSGQYSARSAYEISIQRSCNFKFSNPHLECLGHSSHQILHMVAVARPALDGSQATAKRMGK
jgi:hypothetical protein